MQLSEQVKQAIPGMHPNLDANTAVRATGTGVNDESMTAPHLGGTATGTGTGVAPGAGGMNTEVHMPIH